MGGALCQLIDLENLVRNKVEKLIKWYIDSLFSINSAWLILSYFTI